MIKVNEIAFVGYPVTDQARARAFYEGVLGLKATMEMDSDGHFWIEYEIGDSTLGLSNYWKPPTEPKMGPISALEVGDYDRTLALLKEKGVPILETNESPVCFSTMFADPDGNSLFIHKRKGAPVVPQTVIGMPFTCYPVRDRQRAYDFCENLFGLTRTQPDFVSPEGFWSEYNIGTGTLALGDFWKPAAEQEMAPALALELDDFDAAVAELRAKNIRITMEPMETPVCFLGVILDPDGNSYFIHKRKTTPA